MSWLSQTWSAVWPNLLASVLWSPVALVHITRSNRKHMGKIKVELGFPEPDVDQPGEHLPGE